MQKKTIIHTKYYLSPCGKMIVGETDGKLCLCDWRNGADRSAVGRRLEKMLHAEFEEGTTPVIEDAIQQLKDYFRGNRKTFDVPLLLAGTEFQMSVWKELQSLPYGQTASYAWLARRTDKAYAVRAVAAAVAANALSIFIPCHRIVGSNSSLTGYAGGLPAKQKLLDLEREHVK